MKMAGKKRWRVSKMLEYYFAGCCDVNSKETVLHIYTLQPFYRSEVLCSRSVCNNVWTARAWFTIFVSEGINIQM
jgi:hypothetical protein